MIRLPHRSTCTDTLFPDTTLFRSDAFRAGFAQLDLQFLAIGGFLIQAVDADFQAAPSRSPMAMTSPTDFICVVRRERSEEHTSELQSLMRISYAVFCLKKKN